MIVRFLIALVLVALICVSMSYSTSYYIVSHGPRLMQIVDKPYLTDTSSKPITSAKMGQTIILHETVIRAAIDCYADYLTVMRNPDEIHQFQMRRSSMITTASGKIPIPIDLEVPKDAVPGHYHLTQTAYPVCSSMQLSMFDTGLDLWIDIER